MAKALSIKNPWAFLIAAGLKNIENRSWPVSYRGRLLIHASQKIDVRHRDMSQLFTREQWAALPLEERNRMTHGIFTASAIIGEADVVGCVNNDPSVWAEPGQWHWQLKNPVLYKNPILNVKGALSLWEFDLNENGLAWAP